MLLAFKIWNVARKSAQYRSSNIFTPVLRVIIESGAVYSVTITAALISFVVQSNSVYVVLDMVSPLLDCAAIASRSPSPSLTLALSPCQPHARSPLLSLLAPRSRLSLVPRAHRP